MYDQYVFIVIFDFIFEGISDKWRLYTDTGTEKE